jgi:hypothetical protein
LEEYQSKAGEIYTDENSTAQDSRPTSSERSIEDDGESLVGDDVTEQQSHQHPMFSFLEESKHTGGIPSFGFIARGFDDLQIDLILSIDADG